MARKAKNTAKNTAKTTTISATIEIAPTPIYNAEEIAAFEVLSAEEQDAENAAQFAIDAAIEELVWEPEIEPTAPAVEMDLKQALNAVFSEADAAVDEADMTAVSDEAANADEAPAEDLEDNVVPFKDLMASVSVDEAEEMHQALVAAYAERAEFERDANPLNDNIQKTLSKEQKKHLTPGIVRAFVAAEVDPNYINENEVGVKRRNVYALDKLRDILYGAVTGHMKNAINIACVTSLFRLQKAGAAFTGAVALACASDKVAVAAELKALLVRHTVAESTASTQSSSTMTALEVLGVVKNTGTRPHPIYVLVDNALTRRLQEVVAA